MTNELNLMRGTTFLHTNCLTIENLESLVSPTGVDWNAGNSRADHGVERAVRHIHIHVTEQPQLRPVWFLSRRRALITTDQSSGIANFAGISQAAYLRLCLLVALTQLRALAENPIIEPEDFACQSNPTCLFSWHHQIQDYAYVFERRAICPGCQAFYLSLGVKNELAGALAEIESIGRGYTVSF
jgi:hypothetical protein